MAKEEIPNTEGRPEGGGKAPRAGRRRARSTLSNHVGLKPKADWHRRNFLTEVLIPSLFARRGGPSRVASLPLLRAGQIGLTWIGHASFLIRAGGRNILIDPNWANWLKVIKRLRKPGIPIHDLPDIDLVLVTHAHFDHLDRKTLRTVARDQPIIVPVGVGNLVHDLGFRDVHELDEWQDLDVEGIRVTLTPCAHWGARVLHDAHRGYGGFLIEHAGRSVYHCGDSAYFDGFREIGRRRRIDVALLPIGAYDPPSGREVHMTPEEAMRAFLDLGADWLVPMHFGSFRLSYEPLQEPPGRLLAAADRHRVAGRLRILTEGEPLVL